MRSLLLLASSSSGRRRTSSIRIQATDSLRRLVWNETTTAVPAAAATPAAAAATATAAAKASPQNQTTTVVARRTDFYDAAVERYAQLPIVRLSLASILRHERGGLGGAAAAGAAGAAAAAAGAAPPPAAERREGGAAGAATLAAERVLSSARHAHAQLPRRLARRLVDLQLLPHVVASNPHIQRVYHSYGHAFDVLRAFPEPRSLEDNARFCALLRRLVDEHAPMLSSLAQGLKEVKRRPLLGPALDLDAFLDAMLRSRVSRRLLAEHHLALSAMCGGGGGGAGGGGVGAAGCVDPALDVREAVEFAAQRTALACLEAYGVAPEVTVVVSAGDGGVRAAGGAFGNGSGGGSGGGGGGSNGGGPHPPTAHLPYVASHLDYMVSEILKNALRAVSERHLRERAAAHARFCGAANVSANAAAARAPPLPALRPPPPVVVRICAPPGGDVTLRFSDQGGGIDPRYERRVWQYGWTTVGDDGGCGGADDGLFGSALGAAASPSAGARRHEMAGLGFGLPLTRLYARYFGGELALQNMPGYGVDAFLTLRRLELEQPPPSAPHPPPPLAAPSSSPSLEGEGALPGDAPVATGVAAAAAAAASSVHSAQKDADLSDVRRRRREKERMQRRQRRREREEQGEEEEHREEEDAGPRAGRGGGGGRSSSDEVL